MSRGTVVATPVTSRLEVSGLKKHYGSRQVVQDVHLAVGAGLRWGGRQWVRRATGCASPPRYRQQGQYNSK